MKYKDYFYLIIMLFIASINFNIILKPLNLVVGGTQGLSIIIHKFIPISHSIIILVINIFMLILSILLLSKKMTFGTILASLIYPLFINITNNFIVYLKPEIAITISGLISGFTNGMIYKLGFSTGGIGLLPPIINKYFKFKIGTIHFFINLIILLLNIIFFGINKAIYSIIIMIICSIIINIIN